MAVTHTSDGVACERIELVGTSGLTPDGGTTSRNYILHGAKSIEEAEYIAGNGRYIPLVIPGHVVPGIAPVQDPDTLEVQLDADCNVVTQATDAASTWPTRYLTNLQITPLAQRKGHWSVEASYEGCILDGFELSFSTSGGTKHVKYGEDEQAFPAGSCDFNGAINVAHDGTVGGCDIPDAQPRFTLTKCYPPNFMTCERYATLSCAVGCTNESNWGPNEGSPNCFISENLVFLGASGQVPRYGPQRISFEFEFMKDRTEEVLLPGSNAVTQISVKGTRKLWVRSERQVPIGCNWEIVAPESAHVVRVHDLCDFGELFEDYGFPNP